MQPQCSINRCLWSCVIFILQVILAATQWEGSWHPQAHPLLVLGPSGTSHTSWGGSETSLHSPRLQDMLGHRWEWFNKEYFICLNVHVCMYRCIVTSFPGSPAPECEHWSCARAQGVRKFTFWRSLGTEATCTMWYNSHNVAPVLWTLVIVIWNVVSLCCIVQLLRFKYSSPTALPQLTNLSGLKDVMQIRSLPLQQRVSSSYVPTWVNDTQSAGLGNWG